MPSAIAAALTGTRAIDVSYALSMLAIFVGNSLRATMYAARLADDPYAAALVAQHRLHVYRRYAEHPEWRGFFANVQAARDSYLQEGAWPLAELLRDYKFVRAGDLASLAFCNNWADTADDGCGYAMHLGGSRLTISPDPFGGHTIGIFIEARQIAPQPFDSAERARSVVASAPTVTLSGQVMGSSI
jgi:uncharacterized protein DUF3891